VPTADVTQAQIVELITSGRTGNIGLAPAMAAESA
jgi:D-xylose transport system ATP-binding protein